MPGPSLGTSWPLSSWHIILTMAPLGQHAQAWTGWKISHPYPRVYVKRGTHPFGSYRHPEYLPGPNLLLSQCPTQRGRFHYLSYIWGPGPGMGRQLSTVKEIPFRQSLGYAKPSRELVAKVNLKKKVWNIEKKKWMSVVFFISNGMEIHWIFNWKLLGKCLVIGIIFIKQASVCFNYR